MRQLWVRPRAPEGRARPGRQASAPARGYLATGGLRIGSAGSSPARAPNTGEGVPWSAAFPLGLRAGSAELVGSRLAQRFEVRFDEGCCDEAARARVAPVWHDFDCPISGDAMREPVMASDGHVYDRAAIERWFVEGRQSSPLTNLELQDTSLMPLLPLRRAIEAFLNGRPEVLALREGRCERERLQALERTVASLEQELRETQAALQASRRQASELALQLEDRGRCSLEQAPLVNVGSSCGECDLLVDDSAEDGFAPVDAQLQRGELITNIFRVLTDKEVHVGLDQLRRFAGACGFQGSLAEWTAEYEAICAEYGCSAERGMDLDQFACFLEDADGSAHCSDDELGGLLALLERGARSEIGGALSPKGTGSAAAAPARCIWSSSGWDGWPVCVSARTAEQLCQPGPYAISPRVMVALAASRRAVGGG